MSDGDSEEKGGSSFVVRLMSKFRGFKSSEEQSSQAEDLKPGLTDISVNLNETEPEKLEQFCAELESPKQTVEILRLIDGSLSKRCCLALTSALEAKPSSLRELHLNGVKFQNHDQLKLLCDALGRQHCRIRTLRLVDCDLRWDSCETLSSAIMSNPSHLKELDLSINRLEDVGMKHLCQGLMKKNCTLERLKLTSCHLSEEGCTYLKPLLISKYSHLQKLDLSCNSLKDDGIKELSVGLSSPNCQLTSLSLTHCEVSDKGWASLVKALKKRPVPLKELDFQGNDLSFEGMKSLNEFKMGLRIGEGSSTVVQALRRPISWTKIPSTPHFRGEINKPPSDKSHLTLASSRRNTQDEKTEVNKAQGTSYFLAEVFNEHGRISYRLRGLGPGVFLCQLTGLGFTMTQRGELLYKIIQWDEELLQAAGKVPAGPLFKIEGTTNAVSQLHLLHCEPNPVALSNDLSAVHMSDEGMSILQPLMINETHVVVDVSHFSGFGLVVDFVRGLLNIQRPISSQVLLFHRPIWTEKSQKINVFLLPKNVPLEEVKQKQENAYYIEATSSCHLIKDHAYTLQCPEATLVQPVSVQFDLQYGPNYHPTFEIRLSPLKTEATVTVCGAPAKSVWTYHVDLTPKEGVKSASGSTSFTVLPSANEPSTSEITGRDSGMQDVESLNFSSEEEEKVFTVRKGFIDRVSGSIVKSLLDIFLQREVINYSEKEQIQAKQQERDIAEALIDMVLKKGKTACKIMIDALRKLDPFLSDTLKLTQGDEACM